ncbi:MAG: multicopper oxidase domain-containing protein [Propioniciclava sp.]
MSLIERPKVGRPHTLLRDLLSIAWLSAAALVALVHTFVPAADWLMVHLVTLGALTHAAVVWSEHFAHTLLRTPATPELRRNQNIRILTLAGGALAVCSAMVMANTPLLIGGASAVGLAVLWHASHLGLAMRRALPARFRVVTRYYILAALWLPVGITCGVFLAQDPPAVWEPRLWQAHLGANLLGWIGFTVVGTLITFWPTLLRTRMDGRAERLASQALWPLVGGVAAVVAGALAGLVPLLGTGLVVYIAGWIWAGRALVRPLRTKGLREFAPASVLAALVWLAIGVGWITVGWLLPDADLADRGKLAAVFVVGFGCQLLVGALSYLIPSLAGGGPAVLRVAAKPVQRWATWRLTMINAGLLIWMFPSPSWVRVTVSSVVLLALMTSLPLLLRAVIAARRARHQQSTEERIDRALAAQSTVPRPAPVAEAPPTVWSGNQLMAAIALLVLAVTIGTGVDPAAAGISTLPSVSSANGRSDIEATGEVTRVKVNAVDMRFVPSTISVPAGNQLIVELTNTDPTTIHDLMIGTARTPRLAPGETAELDAGIMTASIQGYCTVAGHRQMGMVLDIVVDGGAEVPDGSAPDTTLAPVPAVPDATLTGIVDPVLPPMPAERTHKLTFAVTEVPAEVAPGLWQTRWTYNGSSVGPTLRGRIGDTFEITLVNEGTMGHSIDFHAGELAPDQPMRTIPPGESLVYTFTATRAGAWLYHCATTPMSLHISGGMHGAVIIEPDDLPEVDRSYVVVQSEVYLSNAATTAAAAQPPNMDKITAERPDRVVFNGVANQYDQEPFTARVGERVRFWVVDAGPNRLLSFHIVGGQFDAVWNEGRYTVGPKVPGAGAQVLPLFPGQGGFVEIVFPEPGNYPVVNHIMVDAERGAHGVVRVTE